VKGISFMPRERIRALMLSNGHKVLFNPETTEEEIATITGALRNFTSENEMERFMNSKGIIYEQAPFSAISEAEYQMLVEKIPVFDPSILNTGNVVAPSDGSSTKYCDALACSV